jgi:hypothetical protein
MLSYYYRTTVGKVCLKLKPGTLVLLVVLSLCHSCTQGQKSGGQQTEKPNENNSAHDLFISTDEDVAWLLVVNASIGHSVSHDVKLTPESLDAVFDSIGDGTRRAHSACKMGLGINQTNASGDSFLMAAIGKKDAELVALLLKNGADTGFRNKNGQTALDLSNQLDLIHIVKLINAHSNRHGLTTTNNHSIRRLKVSD